MQIRSNYNSFNETEQKIANYILNQPQRIVNCTINEVADEIGIAVSTVFDFVRKLAWRAFPLNNTFNPK
ncbi:MurR/RpiR family transcriptional regulator [Oceanobacillus rekensis]|uniref:MurR/RpiR family transcriptional regulator n=1 Tax=Oceanobacillus rekensis TaxID=937927 RepID=UPI000B444521